MAMQNYLGYLDATSQKEKEFIRKTPEIFVRTSAITRGMRDNINFICGRRGAGKSAFLAMMEQLLEADISIGLSGEDYEQIHGTLLSGIELIALDRNRQAIDIELVYYHLWKYILDLLVFKAGLKIKTVPHELPEQFAVIHSYMSDIGKTNKSAPDIANYAALEILKDAQATAAPLNAFALECKNLINQPEHIKASEAAQEIFTKYRGVITIDTMERYYIENSGLYALRGMCRAIKDFHKGSMYKQLYIKCGLPAELTDQLFVENLAKFHEVTEYLHWNYAELLRFLAVRYCFYLSSKEGNLAKFALGLKSSYLKERPAGTTEREFYRKNFWEKIAPPKVHNRYGWLEDSCAYMFRHTQKRPREVLSCIDHIISDAMASKDYPKISEQNIIHGLHERNNLYQLLSDNLSIYNLPKINESIKEIASDLLAGETMIFTGSQFSNFAKRALSALSTTDILDKADFAKKLLLRSGLVGTVMTSEKGEGHLWVDEESECKYYVTQFEYLIPGYVNVGPKSLCAVHPILADSLNLRPREKDKGVVYPLPERDDFIVSN